MYHSWLPLLLTITALLITANSLYSPHYHKCRLNQSKLDPDAIAIADLQIQKVPTFYSNYYIEPVIQPELALNYQQFRFFYHKFIGAGGSGEVYMVEDQQTQTGKIIKRYFDQKPYDFRYENFIMNRLNYSIQWTKQCDAQHCQPQTKQFHTVAIFPDKQSTGLKNMEFDDVGSPILFYKILQELDKTHRAGIIHQDIKYGNILVNAKSEEDIFQVQLIDWNLSHFYYKGFDWKGRRGTRCFYAPEILLKSTHITPAVDVWALGIVAFHMFTGEKPFLANCKKDELYAAATLTGGQKIVEMFKKYNYNCPECLNLLGQIESKAHGWSQRWSERSFESFKPRMHRQIWSRQLYNVLMRMVEADPEKRATPAQLMQMQFFNKIQTLPPIYLYHDKGKKKAQKTEASAQPPKPSN